MKNLMTAYPVMLPTEKASHIAKSSSGRLTYYEREVMYSKSNTNIAQHLYLVSDEEIKVGDWVINKWNELHQLTNNDGKEYTKTCKKVIASTDLSMDLTNPNGSRVTIPFPSIPPSFIEAYAKANGKIKEVQVSYQTMWYNEGKGLQPFPDHKTTDRRKILITRKDGTVIIHQAKKYSKEEVLSKIYEYWGKTHGKGHVNTKLIKYLEENL